METETAVQPEDVKEQELQKELEELSDNPVPVQPEAVKPEDDKKGVEPQTQSLEEPADSDSVKETEVKPPVQPQPEPQPQPEIDWKVENEKTKAELEKERTERKNLNRALTEMRFKRKRDLEKLAALQPKINSADDDTDAEEEDKSIDPDVERTIKSTIAPELEEIRQEIRVERFVADESRMKSEVGADKYKAAMETFKEIISPESPLHSPAILNAFIGVEKPAEFAYRIGTAYRLDDYIETVRKETAEKTKKETIEELKNSANKIIPSLSSVSGGAPQVKQPDTMRREMDEL